MREQTAPLVLDAHLVLAPLAEKLREARVKPTNSKPHVTPWLVLTWPKADGDSIQGAISVSLRARDGEARLRFMSRGSVPGEITQSVKLITRRGSHGGEVWWFICPETGARSILLYMPLGCDRFLSARGHHLLPASQRGLERETNLARLYAKLGVHYIHGEMHIPARHVSMHPTRYNGIVAKINRLVAELCGPPGFMNMRPKPGRPRKVRE